MNLKQDKDEFPPPFKKKKKKKKKFVFSDHLELSRRLGLLFHLPTLVYFVIFLSTLSYGQMIQDNNILIVSDTFGHHYSKPLI